MKSHSLIISLILMVGYLTPVQAVTDAELEALEKQIEQQETEEKKQAEAKEKKKAEAEVKRKSEAEKQAEEKRVKEIVEKRLSELEKQRHEEEKRKLEKTSQAELERKRQEEEAKRIREEEAATPSVSVIFFRKSSWGLTGIPITHAGARIGVLSNNSFFIHYSTPGKQTFSTSYALGEYDQPFSLELEPRSTIYIKLTVNFTSLILELVQEEMGIEAVKGLKNVGNINPTDVLNDYDESEAYKEPSTQQAPL